MLKRLRSLLREKPSAPIPLAIPSRADKYGTGMQVLLEQQREAQQRQVDAFLSSAKAAFDRIHVWRPQTAGAAMDAKDPLESLTKAMDSGDTGLPSFKAVMLESGSQLSLMPWYLRQGFIGYQNVAFIAQHWLIYKACATPVDDAIRNGYDITTDTGEELPEDALKLIKRFDRKIGVKAQLRDFATKGRIFGIRIALFKVDSEDPQYYEKPFNIDGVKAGTYKGVSQVDPYWCAPILDITAAAVPSSGHFYEPTWWLIGSRRVHRTHLVIFKYADPADVLKPLYLFGGIPLPQMIMERVYCSERTANEAPALALSKRTTVWKTDKAAMMADSQKANELLSEWIAFRDNFGIKIGGTDDEFQQFDTPLADFDQLIMTQYGLVAATAGMPVSKLLGTTPGGFQSTGEYEEASYHEMLESMQERDLTPFVERHHELVMRSEVVPKFADLADAQIVINWHETDAMTHEEKAAENLSKAQTGATLIASGAIDAKVENARVAKDKESGYHGIGVDLAEVEILSPEEQMDRETEQMEREAAAQASASGSSAAKADAKPKPKAGKK